MGAARQAILDAIRDGCETPKEIGKSVGKKPQTVSKMLYVMYKEGEVQRLQGGRYILDNSPKPQLELSKLSLDNSLDDSKLEEMVAKHVKRILSSHHIPIKQHDDENLQLKVSELQVKFDQALVKLNESDDQNAKLQTQASKLENEKSELICERDNLNDLLQSNNTIPFAKLFALVTSNQIEETPTSIALGKMIGLNSDKYVGNIRKKGLRELAKQKKD